MDLLTATLHLNFVETNAPALRGLASKVAFKEFSEQYGNFRDAMSAFLENNCLNEAFRFGTTLVPFWMGTKRLDEGLAFLETMLAVPGGDDALRGRVCFDVGYLKFWKGNYEQAAKFHQEAIRLGRQARNSTVVAIALTGLARIALGTDLGEAYRLCLEALDVASGAADPLGSSHAIHVLGVVAQMSGNFQGARELMRRRIALVRKAGNFVGVSSELGNLSMVERQLGNLDEAEALAIESLEIDVKRGDELAIPWKVNGLLSVAVDRGEYEHAATLLGIADTTMRISGGDWPPDELVHYKHAVSILQQEMSPIQFEEIRARGSQMSYAEAIDYALSRTPSKLISI